ncbi:hypothetical protein BDN72DRAFT_870599 [Pluteus cervinus]|uniref:Uncharacterized protein n=1 Tax=Pluteus cervinus TaxID=181527 RepID=A0ACD3AV98_9AGAR|nr:hypothetical protein BDN72DRAFT_870599 [Pluteus cervinus]
MVYIPGVSLRLTTESLKSRQHPYPKSDSSAPSSAEMTRAKEWPNLVRKKSGQILKSSLKASSSATRASLTVGTFTGTSKSEPTTPTHKAVHFDSHLEHVKLFLAEQKPLAVSRDGSPTDDTSGTDSDFPSFMYGDLSDDSGRKKSLSLNVVNMPSSVDLNANVALEDLALSPHDLNIIGRIRLRNLAYSKAVAVRFTFDSWQTTSEVAGRYEKTIDSEFDRFVFTIRLTDLLSRVEDKILHLAIRYSVGGKEYWDNNGGNNYVAKFAKGQTSPEKASDAPGSALAKLHSKLERVVQGTEGFPSKLSPTTQTSEPLPSHATLTSRYTWGKAYKSPWTPPEISSPPRRLRHQSYPVTTKPKSNYAAPAATSTITPAVPKIRPLGSPREIDGSDTTSKSIVTDELLLSPLHSPVDKSSRHHRRGYFDLDHMETSDLKRTPSGTPPTGSIGDLASFNAFCFYTGPQASPTRIPRAHSANDVGEIFASMSPEVPGFSRRGFHTPVRSLAAVALAVTEGVDFGGDVSPGTTPVAAKTRTELSFS